MRSIFGERHRWYFYPLLTHEELLVFRTYDSAELAFPLHTSFTDEAREVNADADARRMSCEVRVLLVFPPEQSNAARL